MKCASHLLMIAVLFVSVNSLGHAQEPAKEVTVAEPLTETEKACVAKLTCLRSVRLAWTKKNRVIGVSLKGTDANDRTISLSSNLPGMRALVLVAFPQNRLTNHGLAPLGKCQHLELLSIAGRQIDDGALVHIRDLPALKVLVLHGNFTDGAMDTVAHLTKLEQLDLTQCPITDNGLQQLPSLTDLQVLILNGTQMSNASLPAISELKKLSELYLGDTAIDDAAVEQLQKMQQLDRLFIKGTKISEDGVNRLLQALPSNCQVIHDDGTSDGQRVPETAMVRSASNVRQVAD